ncbi:MAG: hypothetical protein L6R41_004305 [Letrouitia leprolyta]|nr:MAG: hypothetical protein L6R41_004305 [Letrouitia leprolyta]
MEEFAQTRTPDDLFDDDFTPDIEPVVQEFVQPPKPQSRRGQNNGSRGRGRGRPAQSQHQQQLRQNPAPQPTEQSAAANEAPATEPDNTPKPSTAVRGDRSATGGNAKPKLTEEELSAKLAAVKLNNAKREEAHRLAEADEASFQQREAKASQRRQEEGRARRLMDQEREKNRLRKLGAQGGREWDEGKEEQPASDPRRSHYQRGAHGGVQNYYNSGDRSTDLRINSNDDFGDRGYGSRGGRGRGGRGRGRSGRGRGGYVNNIETLQHPVPNPDTDFPALPSAQASKTDNVSKTSQSQGEQQPKVDVPSFQPAESNGQSWADEVNAKTPEGGW